MVTKKVLISGLAIASLALTGCSAIQTAVNNKIASTTKEISGNINSEVAKTTDALKAQGEKMQSDFGTAADQLKKEAGIVDGTIYTNTKFSFSLQFPKSWGKVTTKEVQSGKYIKSLNISSQDKLMSYGLAIIEKKDAQLVDIDFVTNIGNTDKYVIYASQEPGVTDEVKAAIDKSFKAL
ncbi:MAG: hypothetical protein WC101_00910 [Candidatus Gracilibacteria bacterium]